MPDTLLIYDPKLEINRAHAKLYPNNCSVIERTADGVSVGACWHHLGDGARCPRHGVVKIKQETNDESKIP